MDIIRETIRATLQDMVALKSVALYHGISQYKSNWVKFTIGRNEVIVASMKKKGAAVKLVTSTMVEVHVSITNLTNRILQELGLVPNMRVFCNEHAAELTEAGFNGLEVKAIREGLMLVRVGAEKYHVLERTPEEVYEGVSQTVKLLYGFSHQWLLWSRSADVKEIDGAPVLSFPNGLSVRMVMSESTYCNVKSGDDYIDMSTPYEFYWWLKKFF